MSAPKEPFVRPRLLLLYADSAYAAQCGRYFRRQGWEVRLAPCGSEARRLIPVWHPSVVVIDTDLAEENGWLTCAKLTADQSPPALIMMAPKRSQEMLEKARTPGTYGLVCREDGVEALADLILGKQILSQAV